MIQLDEFRYDYKEDVEVEILLEGRNLGEEYTFEFILEGTNDDEEKGVILCETNGYKYRVKTTFSLITSHYQLRGSLKNSNEIKYLPRVKESFQDILTIPGGCKQVPLSTEDGSESLNLKVSIVPYSPSFPMVSISLQCTDLPLALSGLFGMSDPFVRVHRKNAGFGNFTQIYETEVIRNETNPTFKPIRLSKQRLCGGIFKLSEAILLENSRSKYGTIPSEVDTL